MRQRAAIILAAGKSSRMKSAHSKVLHEVGGRSAIDWSIALVKDTGCDRIVCVVSPDGEAVADHVRPQLGNDALAVQREALGTGHAVQAARDALAGFEGDMIVLFGDSPLIPSDAVERLFAAVSGNKGIGVLGFEALDAGNYGRLVTTEEGTLEAIVEAREASEEQLAIRLCNSGVMAGDAQTMFRLLDGVTNDNAKGEYYLTDLVALARAEGHVCYVETCPENQMIGCDTRADLAAAEAVFQNSMRAQMLDNGVSMIAPDTVYFSYDTQIEPDVLIEPNVVFGPGVHVASGAVVHAFSHIEGAKLGAGAHVGPYVRLRKGSDIGAGAKIGNFVEVKNSVIGEGAKASHLSYLGDGDVGAGTNIGAGTIFCNYDGFLKYQTTIGENAFIGSNSSLIAPVTIGDGAMVGSGSVVTENVEPDALYLSRSKPTPKQGWATKFRAVMTAKKSKKG
ncbi:MAG: bifunctional UDP-N-acetylglucosamine diphosphorylase/glucosamine-1-phosphate N-acetyltransferase GlmU [Hyphomonadaceae bacterium]